MDKVFLQSLIELLLEHVSEGVHVTDSGGYTLYYNTVAARIDGIRPEEAMGKHVLEMFPSLDGETSTILRALKGGDPVLTKEQSIRNMYGSPVFLESETIPLKSGGAVVGAVDITRNLTQVKQLAEKVVDLQSEVNAYRYSSQPGGEREQARYVLDDIVGRDIAVQEVKNRALRAARTNSPVLVSGETGTGKELLVQGIHNASPRRPGPFISQNCAALPASLMEGILFGTVKGSFTGAENRPGLVELADGGTLLLDEITCLDIELQSKLLRFIQDGFVRRIGDAKVRRVNVRIIASTNVEPREAVEKSLLRPDLYYRLNVVNLHLPPLRERREDILLLGKHFLKELNRRMGTEVKGLAAEVEMAFLRYDWPGNVRELRATIEGALNIAEGEYLELRHLPAYLLKRKPQPELNLQGMEGLALHQALARVERTLISQALAKAGNNISRTAKLLGIPRQTLQYKLQSMNLQNEKQ